jgi:thiamine-phosphate pyrophosphorylase
MPIAEPFGLYLVLTDPVAGYERCTEAAVAAGVRYVQLRMKDAPRALRLDTARRLRAITAGSSTRLVVNDDPDLAAEAGADGAHLGQDDEPLDAARRRLPQLRCWGLSTHNEAQAAAAVALAPDYIGVGPVFATPTKAVPDPVVGLARLGRIVAATPLAAVAIGGIHAGNLRELKATGAANFAVVRAVCASPEPRDAIRQLQTLWQDAS